MGGGVSRPVAPAAPKTHAARFSDEKQHTDVAIPYKAKVKDGANDKINLMETEMCCKPREEEAAVAVVAAIESSIQQHKHRYDNCCSNDEDDFYDKLELDGYYECGDDDEEDGPENDTNVSENRENWNMLTNSLDMDGEELLFNMLYFSNNEEVNGLSAPQMISNAMNETVALHSENNTPYKLHPVPESELKGIISVSFSKEDLKKIQEESDDVASVQCCCCMDDLVIGQKVVKLPACHHSFHTDCLFKWFRMQNWCPICRARVYQSVTAEESPLPRKRIIDAVSPREHAKEHITGSSSSTTSAYNASAVAVVSDDRLD